MAVHGIWAWRGERDARGTVAARRRSIGRGDGRRARRRLVPSHADRCHRTGWRRRACRIDCLCLFLGS